MDIPKKEKRILIVGGGFAGVTSALNLAKKKLKNTKITLVSNKMHFEYYPRIYRAVTGNSPMEICIPLSEIFSNKKEIEFVQDEITHVNLKSNLVVGKSGSEYLYDEVIFALGSEAFYFGIEGVQERSFSFKSIHEALRLKRHLHKLFEIPLEQNKDKIVPAMHVVIVGGGPAGIELAGELTKYMERLARKHKVNKNFVTIDILEAGPRIAPSLPECLSARLENRLRDLGVNIFLNRALVKEDLDQIVTKDMIIKTDTLIWTAGTRANSFLSTIEGIETEKNGRVKVDEFLRAPNFSNVYFIGDSAQTPYSGLAQTAIYDANYIVKNLARKIAGIDMMVYKPRKVAYAVPIGKHWAALYLGSIHIFGIVAWMMREVIDFKFFLSVLPFSKAFQVFRNHKLCESCPTCAEATQE